MARNICVRGSTKLCGSSPEILCAIESRGGKLWRIGQNIGRVVDLACAFNRSAIRCIESLDGRSAPGDAVPDRLILRDAVVAHALSCLSGTSRKRRTTGHCSNLGPPSYESRVIQPEQRALDVFQRFRTKIRDSKRDFRYWPTSEEPIPDFSACARPEVATGVCETMCSPTTPDFQESSL
jgi:hypothetical protein